MALSARHLYLSVRRYVDRDQASRGRPATPFLGLLLLVVMGVADHFLEGAFVTAAWALAVGLALVWTAFAGWRAYRLFKAAALKQDRQFDQHGKFRLHPDYWVTKSVARARRRRSQP